MPVARALECCAGGHTKRAQLLFSLITSPQVARQRNRTRFAKSSKHPPVRADWHTHTNPHTFATRLARLSDYRRWLCELWGVYEQWNGSARSFADDGRPAVMVRLCECFARLDYSVDENPAHLLRIICMESTQILTTNLWNVSYYGRCRFTQLRIQIM